MDIVIGYQGKDHVKAEQLRRLITGLSGAGTYVLDTQNKLAASMVTANQVRIDTGDIVAAGGAYATVETPETLIIESGATGQKRIDLVVARYEKEASTSVESMELAVVKGTPVSFGDPTDPEISDGSILSGDSPVEVPLWRIPIDGLAPGTPVQLFETIPSIDALRDSVSQGELVCVAGEMPHQPTTSNEGNGVYAQKAGRIVMLHIRGGSAWGPPIGANVTLCTLPKRFWPAKCVSAPYVVPSAAGYGTIGVAENGRIYGSASAGAASSYYTCSIVYLSAS